VLGDVVVREQVVEVRIDRSHVGRHRDLQLLAACRQREERRHCNRQCGRETLDERTVHWILESEPDKSAARCASRQASTAKRASMYRAQSALGGDRAI